MNILPVSLYEEYDLFGEYIDYQRLQNVDADDLSVDFHAKSFVDCPEDAVFGRGVFDCYDYINALNYGIELAKNGYDEVQLVSVSSGRERL